MRYALRIIRQRIRHRRRGPGSRRTRFRDRARRERQGWTSAAPTACASCREVSNERIQINVVELLETGHAPPATLDRGLYLIAGEAVGDSGEGRNTAWLASAID